MKKTSLIESVVEDDQHEIYVACLESILEHVCTRNDLSVLFDNAELSSFKVLMKLPRSSRKLLARLLVRKGPWFLVQESIDRYFPGESKIVEPLINNGFCTMLMDDEVDQVLSAARCVLKSHEIKTLATIFKLKWVSKEAALEQLGRLCRVQKPLFGSKIPLFSHVRKICPGGIMAIDSQVRSAIQRAFSLYHMSNFTADDSRIHATGLLVEFNKFSFVPYECTISQPLFPSRLHLLAYEKTNFLKTCVYNWENNPTATSSSEFPVSFFDIEVGTFPMNTCSLQELTQWLVIYAEEVLRWEDNLNRPAFLMHFTSTHLFSSCLSSCVEALEKDKEYVTAASVLETLLEWHPMHRRRGKWWTRLAIDYKHLGLKDLCQSTSERCLADPYSTSCTTALKRLKKAGPEEEPLPSVVVNGKRIKRKLGTKCDFVSSKDGVEIFCDVETYVIEHFEENGEWQGIHCEGSAVRFLFSLFLWDSLFASGIEDVFQTPFQSGPLDLTHASSLFTASRELILNAAFEMISASTPHELAALVGASWEIHKGFMCIGCQWESFEVGKLQVLASCLGGAALCAIFKRLCLDYRLWCSGFPDLILYRVSDSNGAPIHVENGDFPETAVCFEARIVEVKSETDRLSDKQIDWLRYLHLNKLTVFVCKVN